MISMKRNLLYILLLLCTKFIAQKSDSLTKPGLPAKICADHKKRSLLLDCTTKLHPDEFLYMCENAKNDKVQNTLLFYNKTNKQKKGFRTAAIVSGAATGVLYAVGFLSYIEAAGTNNKMAENSAATIILGGNIAFCGSITFTILSAIKNKKRKKILYKELPDAYNFYVQNL